LTFLDREANEGFAKTPNSKNSSTLSNQTESLTMNSGSESGDDDNNDHEMSREAEEQPDKKLEEKRSLKNENV
jgi:hypothetical protein